MRWKQALGTAAVLGALMSHPLAAQQGATFTVFFTAGASNIVSQPSTWAAERAEMMRAAERDLRMLQFDEARLGISQLSMFQGTTDPVGNAVVFIVERKSHNCSKAARQN